MRFLKRTVKIIFLMFLFNLTLVSNVLNLGIPEVVLAALALSVCFIYYNIRPVVVDLPQSRIKILAGGYELMLAIIMCFTLEALLYAYVWFFAGIEIKTHILIINISVCILLMLITLVNGIIRIFFSSGQLGILPRLCLVLFWWLPVVNIVILRKFIRSVGKEYVFAVNKNRLNDGREQERICKTKYPLLMVHGIFFRDWENFKYWGRIPNELVKNGAVIYYGNHQSTASVEQSAQELKQSILKIVAETGCEKVNIIAHSKGGVDSRYAVSCLGMGKYVASLTTINTPHLGCNYVRKIIEKLPQKDIESFGKKYEALYLKLGDENPDFFSGLSGLTDKECTRLNKIMKDDQNVLCQSVATRMKSHSGAAFPLSMGYIIVKAFEGDNDGLVATKSMVWGDFLGTLTPKGKQGISHGDVIDLTRKNIDGFDVCEFYVDLVSRLRERGL